MRPATLTPEVTEALRRAVDAGEFPGFSFEHAMRFALAGRVAPASDLPVSSLLELDDWLRGRLDEHRGRR
jgi:hypothetical protein